MDLVFAFGAGRVPGPAPARGVAPVPAAGVAGEL